MLRWECSRAQPAPRSAMGDFKALVGRQPVSQSPPQRWHEPGGRREIPPSLCNLAKGAGAPAFPQNLSWSIRKRYLNCGPHPPRSWPLQAEEPQGSSHSHEGPRARPSEPSRGRRQHWASRWPPQCRGLCPPSSHHQCPLHPLGSAQPWSIRRRATSEALEKPKARCL